MVKLLKWPLTGWKSISSPHEHGRTNVCVSVFVSVILNLYQEEY